jgi:hypothetical protein
VIKIPDANVKYHLINLRFWIHLMLNRTYTFFVFLCLTLISNTLLAEQIHVGESLPKIEFVDQNDQAHKLDDEIRILLFAHSKQTGSLVMEILKDAGPDHLQKHNAVYIADISGMPSMVTRLFVLPKMRKISSPIYLARTPEQAAWLPKEEDKVTLLKLTNGSVTQISFSADEESLRSILNLPQPAPRTD